MQKGTVCLRPQIAKANRGGKSYMHSVVKPINLKPLTITNNYQYSHDTSYNNIRLKEWKQDDKSNETNSTYTWIM